jgi:hypothetical protein
MVNVKARGGGGGGGGGGDGGDGGGGDDTASGAEHEAAVLPPLWPLQCQYHGPVPVTAVADPALHRPEVGATVVGTPAAGPHAPLIVFGPAIAGSAKSDTETVTYSLRKQFGFISFTVTDRYAELSDDG